MSVAIVLVVYVSDTESASLESAWLRIEHVAEEIDASVTMIGELIGWQCEVVGTQVRAEFEVGGEDPARLATVAVPLVTVLNPGKGSYYAVASDGLSADADGAERFSL